MRISVFIILFLCIVGLCISPIEAGKSKGLWSGSILSIDLEAYVADIPDTPSFITEKEEAVKTYPQDAESWIDIGKAQLKAENWREAEEAFIRAIDQDQNNTDAWEGYFLVLATTGRYEDLFSETNRAMKIIPQNAEVWFYKGFALTQLGRFEEAIAAYDQALNINPEYAYAWNNKGFTLNKLLMSEEAVGAYDQAIRIDPGYAYAWNGKGIALDNLLRSDEAIVAYDTALKIDPGLADVWYNKGNALNKLGRNEEAVEAYEQAIRIDPEYALAWENKEDVLWDLGRLIDFLDASRIVDLLESDQALKSNPEDIEAWMNKGEALYLLDRDDESLAAYDQILKINPGLADAWINKGKILSYLGRFDEGSAAFDQALKIKPGKDTWEKYFEVLNGTEQYEDLLFETDRAITSNPEFKEAWEYKGKALSRLERFDEANESFEKAKTYSPKGGGLIVGVFRERDERLNEEVATYDQALKSKPEDIEALKNKGEALHRGERYDEAIEAYDQILKITPEDIDVLMNKGEALHRGKRYDEAIAAYDQVLKITPEDPNVWIEKGRALYTLDRYDEGRGAFNQALKINPGESIWEDYFSVLKWKNQYDDLLTETDRAIASNPDFADAWLYKGHALYSLNRSDEAIAAYDRAKGISPSIGLISGITTKPEVTETPKPVNTTSDEGSAFSIQDWTDMGEVLFELGRYDKAIQAYEEALKIDPGNSAVKRLLETAKGKLSN